MEVSGTTLEALIRPRGKAPRGITFIDLRGRSRSLSYDELTRRAGAAGAGLAAAGVEPGDHVAMVIGNDQESVVAALGTWMAGATVVSLPPPPSTRTELYKAGFQPILQVLGCRTVVGTPRLGELLGGGMNLLRHESLTAPGIDPGRAVPSHALVQFTSGSVGSPRGIVLGAAALGRYLETIAAWSELDPARDHGLVWVPLYHDMGLVASFLLGVATSTPMTVMAPASMVLNPGSWLRTSANVGATMTAGSDFAFRLAAKGTRGDPGDLSRVRICVTGGEPISWSTLERFHEVAGPAGMPWEAIMPVYGLAETCAAVTLSPLGRGPRRGPDGTVSVGPPVPGIELRVAETISVRGPWMLDSYATAEGFSAGVDPDGWLTTSDFGRVIDGELYVQGRVDEVITTGGRNHFAEDVEAVAIRAGGAGIFAAAAFRHPRDPGRFALAVEADGAEAEGALAVGRGLQGEVAAALGIRVGPVVVLKPWTIPRTSSGKVRRPECRRLLAEEGWPPRKVLAVTA